MDDVSIFILLALLEVLLLLGFSLWLLRRRNRRLQRQLGELRSASEGDAGFASVASGYLPYLEQELLESRERLEQAAVETDGDERLAPALRHRIGLLTAEKKLAELCNDYPERRWEHVSEQFQPPPEGEPASGESEAEAGRGGDEADDLAGLQASFDRQGEALQMLQQRIAEVREDPQAAALERLETQFAELERRYREAATCLELLQRENERLLARVEHKDQRIDQVEGEPNETVSELEDKLGQQKRSIAELHELVDALQLEEAKAAELQSRLEQFDLASRDMNMCIQVLEEENQFLQDQVRGLLQLDEGESLYRSQDGAGEQPVPG